MTLEEMLALLPDNITGSIDADDLRAIVTQLYNDTATVSAMVAALEQDQANTDDNVTALGNALTALDDRVDVAEAATAALDSRVSAHDAELASLDGRLDAVEPQLPPLDARLDALEANSGDGYAQVFSYLWATSAGPAVGKVTIDAWTMGATKIQVNETTDDGQALTFAVLDSSSSAEIRLLTADGKKLRANKTGPSVDQGAYRDIPISVISITGAAPALNQRTTVAMIVKV